MNDLSARFDDNQARAAYVAIRAGLLAGNMNIAQARKLVIGIHPAVFDSSISDGEKQVQDYEKRQLYAALNEFERRQPRAAGCSTAELFDACVAELNLR